MNLGFDVCSETDFLKSPKAIICGLGKEGVIDDKTSPCGYDEFLNLSKTNNKFLIHSTFDSIVDVNSKFYVNNKYLY